MRITKTEKIWLIAVIVFYVAYNLPFVPAYGSPKGTIIHAMITLIPLWVAVYVGMFRVFRIHRLRSRDKEGDE